VHDPHQPIALVIIDLPNPHPTSHTHSICPVTHPRTRGTVRHEQGQPSLLRH
jgi:hypothetical protein